MEVAVRLERRQGEVPGRPDPRPFTKAAGEPDPGGVLRVGAGGDGRLDRPALYVRVDRDHGQDGDIHFGTPDPEAYRPISGISALAADTDVPEPIVLGLADRASAELLHEQLRSGRFALLNNGARPAEVHLPYTVAALAADDRPMQNLGLLASPRWSQAGPHPGRKRPRYRPQHRLAEEEPHGRRREQHVQDPEVDLPARRSRRACYAAEWAQMSGATTVIRAPASISAGSFAAATLPPPPSRARRPSRRRKTGIDFMRPFSPAHAGARRAAAAAAVRTSAASPPARPPRRRRRSPVLGCQASRAGPARRARLYRPADARSCRSRSGRRASTAGGPARAASGRCARWSSRT